MRKRCLLLASVSLLLAAICYFISVKAPNLYIGNFFNFWSYIKSGRDLEREAIYLVIAAVLFLFIGAVLYAQEKVSGDPEELGPEGKTHKKLEDDSGGK